MLKGINYMRDASDPVAKEDSAYPDWVWTLLTPRPETSDGGIGDKKTLRRKNRENIRDSNFMKSRKT